jgi:1-acyl-sn-glycerol-3-phosphate acyltransferase
MDFPVGVAYRSIMRIGSAHYLAKKELFDGPFGFLFRWLGGIPVDRSSKHNLVDQVADILSKHSDMMIAISPEGTRKKVDRLRTGFYYIAKKAGVPIVMVGFDFLNRRVLVSDALHTTDDPKADFDRILAFFTPIQGKVASRGFIGINNQFE